MNTILNALCFQGIIKTSAGSNILWTFKKPYNLSCIGYLLPLCWEPDTWLWGCAAKCPNIPGMDMEMSFIQMQNEKQRGWACLLTLSLTPGTKVCGTGSLFHSQFGRRCWIQWARIHLFSPMAEILLREYSQEASCSWDAR